MIPELLFHRRLEVIYHKKPDNPRCDKRPLEANKSPLVLAYDPAQNGHARQTGIWRCRSGHCRNMRFWEVGMAMPITRYAKSGDVHIKGLQEPMHIYAALN